MGFFDPLFRREKVFSMRASDQKLWQASRASGISPKCECLSPQYDKTPFQELNFHSEVQDTTCDAWKMMEDLIGTTASRQGEEFAPGLQMPMEMWSQIITLPASISKLTSVKKISLYGSHLVRIPPEVGEMTNLEDLDLYTSYRLHWLPFEITRCLKLKESRVSTRALYGNYKYRPPFPRLGGAASPSILAPTSCSLCSRKCSTESLLQVWISLRVATDVLPLLVSVCSDECIGRLPKPARGYVDHPHAGGLDLVQPPTVFGPPQA